MSNFQKRVREIIRKILGSVPINAEVNVRKLFPSYPAKDHHYDLVIPSYNLVIECHGEQHRTLSTFGEKDLAKAKESFDRQKWRDGSKEDAAWENDWGYVKIWYNDLPTNEDKAIEHIRNKISSAMDKMGEGY